MGATQQHNEMIEQSFIRLKKERKIQIPIASKREETKEKTFHFLAVTIIKKKKHTGGISEKARIL